MFSFLSTSPTTYNVHGTYISSEFNYAKIFSHAIVNPFLIASYIPLSFSDNS